MRSFLIGLAGPLAIVLATAAPAGAAVSISAPASKNLGSAPTGSGSISAQLGTVTVTGSGLVAPSFVATVSATVFTTGAAGANETIGITHSVA